MITDDPPRSPEKDASMQKRPLRTTPSESEQYLRTAVERLWWLRHKEAEDAEEEKKMERLRSLMQLGSAAEIEGEGRSQARSSAVLGLFGAGPSDFPGGMRSPG